MMLPKFMDGRGRNGHDRRVPPVENLHPVVRDLLQLQDQSKMSDARLNALAGYGADSLRRMRRGTINDVRTLSSYAEVFGCEVRLVRKSDDA